jgi:hypothetical protein
MRIALYLISFGSKKSSGGFELAKNSGAGTKKSSEIYMAVNLHI